MISSGYLYRPGHGSHISLRRQIAKWTGSPNHIKAFETLRNTGIWKRGLKVFDPNFLEVLSTYINKAIPLRIQDMALAKKIKSGNYSEKEKKEMIKERTKLRSIRFRFKKPVK
jgi:saccharopine dehydrogenase-like NADP-dependent oxidoreductase